MKVLRACEIMSPVISKSPARKGAYMYNFLEKNSICGCSKTSSALETRIEEVDGYSELPLVPIT
jgi:hypothetical protein